MVYDKNNPKRKGKILKNIEILKDGLSLPYPDPMTNDPDYYASSLFCGENRGNREADKRLMKKYGFKIKYAAERMNERHGKNGLRKEIDISIVVIAHRLSTIQKADTIYVLDNGSIVEKGNHKSLTKKYGIYCRLAEMQKIA